MKKIIILLFLFGTSPITYAQKEFNKWSVELNGGFNKPMGPLTPYYFSPTLNLGHADFGIRYMFNEYFGVAGNLGLGTFREAKDESPSFESKYVNSSLRGVWNLGRSLSFESFSQRLTMLGEFGIGIGYLKQEDRITGDFDPDYVYSFNSSIKTLYSISRKISLQGTISAFLNGRQRYTFDGNEFNQNGRPADPEAPFIHATGTWWTGTLGLNFYLGKAEKHADWFLRPDKYLTKTELNQAVGEIKDMLKDSDGDGIPDYIDKEAGTPLGARVDRFGITLDSDGDGIPDHIDQCPFQPGPSATNGCPVAIEKISEVDYLRKAINDGYLNLYFAFDSTKPLDFSISATQYVSNFMKRNPGTGIEIKGYADELGPEDYNIKLSEKRAKAVYDLLISSGIEASRLSFKGYGEDTSVSKASSGALQMARRVSFEIK